MIYQIEVEDVRDAIHVKILYFGTEEDCFLCDTAIFKHFKLIEPASPEKWKDSNSTIKRE